MADVDHDTGAEKTSAAAEIVGSVGDLLLEIFRRVPPEKIDRNNPLFKLASEHLNSQASYYYPLVRLRLVSGSWKSLISNNLLLPKPFPAAGLIFECGPSSSCIIFLAQSIYTTAPFREINPAPWHNPCSKVIHSCNGLLLCASKWYYSVCNPTTGKHLTLPRVPRDDSKIIRGVYLAFDPCKSPHYKVVCGLGSEEDDDSQFVVYSSETGCWGKCGELFKTNNVRFGNGVYWNGCIHWVGSSELIRFNPDDRLAPPKVMPMPIARNHERYYFGESYGHLHYIGLDEGTREVVVHEMSSGYSGWVVKYKVDLSNVLSGRSYFQVYAVVRGERAEDMFLVLGTSGSRGGNRKIVRFNHDDTFETTYDFNDYYNTLKNPDEFYLPFHFIESLASV